MEISQTVHMTKGGNIEVIKTNENMIIIRMFSKGGLGYSNVILSMDDAKKLLEELECIYNVQ